MAPVGPRSPTACFDVFGTCFTLDGLSSLIEQEFRDEMRREQTNGKTLALAWFYQTQRDFTYLSMTGRYTPIAKVFAATLPRVLIQHMPAAYSSRSEPPADRLDAVKAGLSSLPPAPGLHECVGKLRDAGFDCWGVTNGGREATAGYFAKASPSGSSDSSGAWFSAEAQVKDRIVSCDDISVAKPDPRVYRHCAERIDLAKGPNVFIAAHNWDLGPAKDAGFITAWVAHEEFLPLDDLWGAPDVVAEDLSTLADRIVALTM